MDAVWRSSDISVKESLAEELMAHEEELADSFYGRIVMRNCNVAHYKRRQSVRDGAAAAATNTRKLFHDILEDESECVVAAGREGRKRSSESSSVGHDTHLSQKRRKKASR